MTNTARKALWQPSRLQGLVACGLVVIALALGLRTLYRKPIHGKWMGYTYHDVGGQLVKDEAFGQFTILLNQNGTYEENGNATSGTWVKKGNAITLTPEKFYDLTPAEHRAKYRKAYGTRSQTIERLLERTMRPMVINYNASSDIMTHREPTLLYKYERG